jgi:ubiquinone/menaquinone biosynthesis C-methylase UbiE
MKTYGFRGYEIPVDLMLLTGGGPDTFDAISDAHIANLKRHLGVGAGQTVVEIGCGIGRDAIPLVDVIGPRGKYLGVDIIRPSIDWCNKQITAKHSNFSFVHFNVRDQLHNSTGTCLTSDIRLPVADQTVDRIILQSVFTHMFPPDIKHYLKEFKRILKPGGLCYATVFLYSQEILDSARKTNLTPFNLRLNDPVYPTGAVAYTASFMRALLFGTGMQMAREPLRGAWSGYYKDPHDGQDVLILES